MSHAPEWGVQQRRKPPEAEAGEKGEDGERAATGCSWIATIVRMPPRMQLLVQEK